MVRHLAATAASIAIATAGLVALSAPASAAPVEPAAPASAQASCPQGGVNSDTGTGHATTAAQIRSGPSTSCTAPGAAQPSDTLDYYCWNFGSSGTWTRLRDTRTGVVGWVSDSLLSNGGAHSPC